jgi:hypothetical protein
MLVIYVAWILGGKQPKSEEQAGISSELAS